MGNPRNGSVGAQERVDLHSERYAHGDVINGAQEVNTGFVYTLLDNSSQLILVETDERAPNLWS